RNRAILRAGKEEKWQHTFLKNIFCRFSDAARLQKSRLQAAKVFGIDSSYLRRNGSLFTEFFEN
ncbi:MAG TPA: hypothetical protein PLK08_10065, partial [Phycisphaerae bacterium]|nr:hypothetical protein [Phycisphaerae bacterium]